MAKRKFTIIVEENPEGGYIGRCLELRGAISQGKTIEELKKNMAEAIDLMLETLEEDTKKYKKLTIEIPINDIEEKGILELEGEAAKEFLEYDSRDLTQEEKASLKKAHDYYLSKKY